MKKLIILIIAITTVKVSNAQQEIVLHNATRHLFQASYLNPAMMPKRDHFSFLSMGMNFSNSGFAVKHLLKKTEDDSLQPSLDYLLAKRRNRNFINTSLSVDLFSLKLRIRRIHYALTLRERVSFNMFYPGDFIGILGGNASYIGKTADLGVKLKALHYREYGLSAMRNYWGQLNVGFRLKYLHGMAAVSTELNELSLQTRDTTLEITAQTNYLLNTAGLQLIGASPSDYILNTRNSGFAFDLGGYYHINSKLKVMASIIDLGFINWQKDIKNYYSNGNYTFDGLDILGMFSDSTSSMDQVFSELGDTLQKEFSPNVSSTVFRTNLIAKHYLGATYHIIDSLTVGASYYGQFFNGYKFGLTVFANKQFKRWCNLGLNYSIINRSHYLGASAIFNAGFFQWYIMGDNLFGAMMWPFSTKGFNLRTGFNFTFGGAKHVAAPRDPGG